MIWVYFVCFYLWINTRKPTKTIKYVWKTNFIHFTFLWALILIWILKNSHKALSFVKKLSSIKIRKNILSISTSLYKSNYWHPNYKIKPFILCKKKSADKIIISKWSRNMFITKLLFGKDDRKARESIQTFNSVPV